MTTDSEVTSILNSLNDSPDCEQGELTDYQEACAALAEYLELRYGIAE